jgi:acylphosphatase
MGTMHVRVSGRVQGVGFRWFVRVAARRLQLAGWVKNDGDGSVEVVASGADEKIAELRKLVARGPDGADVAQLVDVETDDDGGLDYPFAMRK